MGRLNDYGKYERLEELSGDELFLAHIFGGKTVNISPETLGAFLGLDGFVKQNNLIKHLYIHQQESGDVLAKTVNLYHTLDVKDQDILFIWYYTYSTKGFELNVNKSLYVFTLGKGIWGLGGETTKINDYFFILKETVNTSIFSQSEETPPKVFIVDSPSAELDIWDVVNDSENPFVISAEEEDKTFFGVMIAEEEDGTTSTKIYQWKSGPGEYGGGTGTPTISEDFLLIEDSDEQNPIGAVTDHNDLENIQGGTDGEYYHLEQSEHTYLANVVANDTIGLILGVIAEPPVYTSPSASISNVSQVAEVGEMVVINIAQTFTPNDAGAKLSETIKKNGNVVSNTNTYSESLVVPSTNTVYNGTVNFDEGATKNNNLGIPDPTGKIMAGSVNSNNRTITAVYPIFFGVSAGAPTVNQALINGGTKIVGVSTGTINITFGASGEYLWFAIPRTSTSKTKWFVDALNQGDIGGGSNLFASEQIEEIDSPSVFWNDIEYKIYVSNYPTTTSGVMQLLNS